MLLYVVLVEHAVLIIGNLTARLFSGFSGAITDDQYRTAYYAIKSAEVTRCVQCHTLGALRKEREAGVRGSSC